MSGTDLDTSSSARRDPTPREIVFKEELRARVQKLVETDPDLARRLLDALREPTPVTRRPITDSFRVLGAIANVLAEAITPTPLAGHPARLSDAWQAVGDYIRHGMDEIDDRLEHHG